LISSAPAEKIKPLKRLIAAFPGPGPSPRPATGRKGGVSELVVHLFLFGVGKDLVSLGDRFKFILGGRIAGIHIRVVFSGEFSVGLLDFVE